MRLIAIDFGTKKSGIAISDPLKIIAQPLKTIFYKELNFSFITEEIKKIIDEYKPIEKIILGITTNLDNSISNTGKIILKFYDFLQKELPNITIILFDEKYSTKKSKEIMTEMKLSIKQKKERKDALAAQKILEDYMDRY
ncbi:Holliday junction resolvase RuvX [Metamycoplasma sualvi]|uniref:Holliday junction resolvase RuvX n=1 Tax=Metamycoplasma sualvi TaxID=2125 RepID=UPI003872F4BD